jgi:phospholipid-binding lipoprotein MlaA
MGLEKHEQDLGLTFARWGAESGPYLVLPFFGPSSVRDAFGRVGDSAFSPYVFATNLSTTSKVELFALDAVSRREKLLSDETLLDDVALSADHYNMIRDAWLQRRQNLVYEGHPPKDDEDEDDPDDAPSAR